MLNPRPLLLIICAACALIVNATAQTGAARLRLAVLDFGATATGRQAAETLARALAPNDDLKLADREESRAAARGAGYAGSLNMSLQEARDLGGALGTDFYLTGDAQTLRRSSSARPNYYEAYASVFIVSARTGRLITWDRLSFEAATPDQASGELLTELKARAARYAQMIRSAREAERSERAQVIERAATPPPVIESAPDDEAAAALAGLRLPLPYRRLRPTYPETAARAEAEATVDVELELDAEGEVARAEVVRWGGFGLDESAVNTARQLHFRPATRDGVPIPLRVLLRYNFRKPAK